MRGDGLKQLDGLKSRGALESYHVLFSRYVDTNSWDMLAILRFGRYEDAARWHEVEIQYPAGLPREAVETVTAVESYPADLIHHEDPGTPRERPVYMVIPYTYSVPPPEYLKYFDDYVRPQVQGWMRAGVLASYDLFLQRYTAARPWDSFLVLEYKDDAALGAREKIVAKVRQELQSNPAWKALADSKHKIRAEKQAVIADELTLPR
jgi:hypothetical protein